MPYTLYGIGTRFYGCAEPRSDGSYVTTEWVVFLFFPIIPKRSLRLKPFGGEGREYTILEVLDKVHAKEVRRIRMLSLILVGLLALILATLTVLYYVGS